MKLPQSSLVLIVSSLIGFVAAQDFTGGNKCVFPVVFFISDTCQDFWKTPMTNITADGQCNYVPGSVYTADVGPGPYYRAICSTDGGYVKYTAVGCSDSTCTQCKQWSVYTGGANMGVFNMKNLQCQDLKLSSFVSYGPLNVRADGGSGVVPVTVAPTPAPVPVPPTLSPVTVAPVASCTWEFRYYDRTATDSAYATCSISNLVAPDQRSVIIADGVCRDSSVPSLGYYQATCDGSGGVVFSKNKCTDATCQNCSLSSDVYLGVSYKSEACWTHYSSPLKAWVLMDCAKSSCSVVTTASPQYSLSASP